MKLRVGFESQLKPGSMYINWILLIAIAGIVCCSIAVGADNQPSKREQALGSLEKRTDGQQFVAHIQGHDTHNAAKNPKPKDYFKSMSSRRGHRHRKNQKSRKGHHHHQHGKHVKKKSIKGKHGHRSKNGHHHHVKHKAHKGKHSHHDKHKAHKHKHGHHDKCEHHGHNHHHRCDNDKVSNNQKCHDGSHDEGKKSVAAFNILVCNNKTISAIYCPKGRKPYPKTHGGDKHDEKDDESCRSLAYLDVITMKPPCPKPIRKDIDNAYSQLTCQDREIIEKEFNFGGVTASSMRANSDIMNAQCSGGFWDDKCTSVGYFCGSSIFGCNQIDDDLYYCGAIGDKPKFVERCKHGGCVDTSTTNGTSYCSNPKCLCPKSGQICGSSFPDSCGLDPDSLYFCKKEQAPPILLGECESGKCPKGGCKCHNPHPECDCKTEGKICGNKFPSSCNLSPTAVYECKGKSLGPELSEECSPHICCDGECTTHKPKHCLCQGDGLRSVISIQRGFTRALKAKTQYHRISVNLKSVSQALCSNLTQNIKKVCGSEFPEKCGLESDSVYICTGDNTKPSFDIKCEYGCEADTGRCKPGPCDCTEEGPICGSTFPDSCNLTSSTLYQCSDTGARPKPGSECPSGECPSGGDACTPESCSCTELGDTCGSNFPVDCNYDPNSLYTCSAVGQPPTLVEKCMSGECPKGSSNCSPDDCACTDDKPTCGSNFPEHCGLDNNTVFTCPSDGRRPIPDKVCIIGECPVGGDDCVINPCLCTKRGPMCGSEFPAECGYPPNAQYKCRKIGSPPNFIHNCTTQCDPATHSCVPGPCDCTSLGIFCGSSFPESCGFHEGVLYSCDVIGELPNISSSCESGSCSGDGKNCDLKPCVCKDVGLLCGSSYPAECNLDPNALYHCASTGSDPIKDLDCPSGTCDPNANSCVPIDKCSCTTQGNVCGSDFPSTCNYESNSLYQCEIGEKPILIHECIPGTCVTGGDNCPEVDPSCLCNSTGTICGSTFPSKCQYDKDHLYTCTEVGVPPTDGIQCPSGSCPSGSDKCAELKNCNCTTVGMICGSSFDVSCGYSPESLYECKAIGDKPIFSEKCESNQCISGNSECYVVDKCECTEAGQTCGSNFPEECHYYPNTLYYCKDEGEIPIIIDDCTSGSCQKGNQTCDPDPCKCSTSGQVCGSTFPPECKREPNSLYFCQQPGVYPEYIQRCESGSCLPDESTCEPAPSNCTCKSPGQICGSTFDPSCGFNPDSLYYCIAEGARPIRIRKCKPGQCLPGESTCKPTVDCSCFDVGLICGSSFPEECNFEPNTQYLCEDKGDTPEPSKEFEPGLCENIIGPIVDVCACHDTGDMCGFILQHENCTEYTTNPNSIYHCEDGEYPVEIAVCVDPRKCAQLSTGPVCLADACSCPTEGTNTCGHNDFCDTKEGVSYTCNDGKWDITEECEYGCQSSTGTCYDKCVCKDSGIICGGALPGCGLNDGTLYTCESGEAPSELEDCTSGSCPVDPDDIYSGKCTPDPCYCKPGDITLCSNEFPASCNYPNNTILSCPDEGGKPIEVDECTTQCIVGDSGAQCEKDPCSCTEEGSFCGSTFPSICYYPPNSVYSCSGKDAPPVLAGSCDPTECYNDGTTAVCKPDPCACTEGGKTLCSSEFPLACGLPPQTVVSCEAPGMLPEPVENCAPQNCITIDGVGRCDKSPCTCDGQVDKICGSYFPEMCDYDPAIIYSCSGEGELPTVVEECNTGLLCTSPPDGVKCDSDICHCKEEDVGTNVCSSSIDEICGYDPNVLLTCLEEGQEWKPVEDCAPGTCDDSVIPQCSHEDCKCPDEDDGKELCGNNFPSHCNLDPNSIYQCSAGKLPIIVKDCEDDICEYDPSTGTATCTPDKCICTAETTTTTCGSSWDTSCRLEDNVMYSCNGQGSKPVVIKDCKPAECIADPEGAKCIMDPCLCDMEGTLCGHDFLESCNLIPEAIYHCDGPGSIPEITEQCLGNCFHSFSRLTSNTTLCINGPCDCPPIQEPSDFCGVTFPTECGYDPNTLYHCEQPGFPPDEIEDCDASGKECVIEGPNANSCQENVCVCSDGETEKCGSEFPDSCLFVTDGVYSCANPKDPILVEPCDYKCDPNPVGHCVEDPCVCNPDVEVMCGSEFPSTCNFDPNTVYTCADPSQPAPQEDCDPNTCIPTPSAHCYVDPCACKAGDTTFCGSSFPAECNLDGQSIYQCEGVTYPTLVTDCKPNNCLIQNDVAVCIDDRCLCKDGMQTACAMDFPRNCITQNPSQMVKCNGAGSKPELSVTCDYECEANVPGVSARCKVAPCACSYEMAGNTVCPSQFPSTCKLDRNKLYQCGNTGTYPVVTGDCTSPSKCVVEDHKGTCVSPADCTCPADTPTICGSTFDKRCGYDAQTVYSCNNVETPTEVTSCDPRACVPGDNSASCESDPVTVCICTQDGPLCGGDLSNCPGLDGTLYYSCSIGQAPFPIGTCTEKGPTSGACLCVDQYPMCSTYFPFECGYDQDQAMSCSGPGAMPQTTDQCGVGKCVNGNCDTNCECTSNTVVCGKQFDSSCGYDPSTIYTCSGSGATPVAGNKCNSADLCSAISGVGRCLGECQCKNVDTVCGAAFPDSCGFQQTAIYRCDYTGATPVSPQQCTVPCNPQNGPDKCGMEF
ncbi:hypothetical protein BGZ76_006471 [Entomortierella beljakovae]|nr:hypothetical protein BGZ76_006471 [Entomortierella beljakovae]